MTCWCEKAREGVHVRVLTDGVGSFGLATFMVPLTQAGGQFAEFLPVGTFAATGTPTCATTARSP